MAVGVLQGRRSGPGLRVTYVDVLRHRGGRGRTRSANPPQRLATPLRPCGEEGAGGGLALWGGGGSPRGDSVLPRGGRPRAKDPWAAAASLDRAGQSQHWKN